LEEQGGIPLSVGEEVSIKEGSSLVSYKVTNKKTELYLEDDPIVLIQYELEKSNP